MSRAMVTVKATVTLSDLFHDWLSGHRAGPAAVEGSWTHPSLLGEDEICRGVTSQSSHADCVTLPDDPSGSTAAICRAHHPDRRRHPPP